MANNENGFFDVLFFVCFKIFVRVISMTGMLIMQNTNFSLTEGDDSWYPVIIICTYYNFLIMARIAQVLQVLITL